MSAVENGKKNVPSAWIPKIIEHYNLNSSEIEELNNAVEESKNTDETEFNKHIW